MEEHIMKTWTGWMLAVGGGIALGFFGARAADGAPVMPESLARVIAALYPDAAVVEVERERDDGQVEFEIKLRQPTGGHLVEIEATEDVGITEIDEELAVDALPETVRQSLKSVFPQADVRKAVKQVGIKYSYEVELLVAGKRHQVTLSTKGKILEVDRKD